MDFLNGLCGPFYKMEVPLLQDMEVWETIGLWRYPVPGSFLLAQFCLGILVGMSILVRSSVFLYLSDKDEQTENGYCSIRGQKHCLSKSNILEKFAITKLYLFN